MTLLKCGGTCPSRQWLSLALTHFKAVTRGQAIEISRAISEHALQGRLLPLHLDHHCVARINAAVTAYYADVPGSVNEQRVTEAAINAIRTGMGYKDNIC